MTSAQRYTGTLRLMLLPALMLLLAMVRVRRLMVRAIVVCSMRRAMLDRLMGLALLVCSVCFPTLSLSLA
jgi:hypothetical protein